MADTLVHSSLKVNDLTDDVASAAEKLTLTGALRLSDGPTPDDEEHANAGFERNPEFPGRAVAGRPDRIRFDLAAMVVVSLVFAFVAVQIDALELLVEWAAEYEEYEIDEVFTLLIVLSFAFGIFAWRRVRELRDQIERRNQAEAAMRHLAMHDTLTGLPNRALFFRRLKQELARAQRDGTRVAMFALDLDKFKRINDVYGHHTGDGLLVAATERLVGIVRKMDTVARLGGDEFAIIQSCQDEPASAAVLAARVVHALAEPFEVDGHEFVTSVSVGITLSGDGRNDPADLLRSADVALYRSKAEGRSTYRFFDPDMDEGLRLRQELERGLREAIAKSQFKLLYQPLYSIPEQELTGFEALLRWDHPTRGLVLPAEFIPIAEEIGEIQRIGEWVLTEACRTATTWKTPVRVAVNVSAVQFKQRDLAEKFKSIITRSGLAPERLEIEITESVLMQDTEAALRVLTELKEFGVRVAMDDFGTGYSSLSYLRKFPFDKIKIDGSFVSDLEGNEECAAIIRAVVAMGQSLGMLTLAEGVESDNQLSQLSEAGCEGAQGFLLGRPMPGSDAAMLIERQPAT